MTDLSHVSMSDRLLVLNERGYVVDQRGVILVGGVEIRVTVERGRLVFRNPKYQEVSWEALLPHLQPVPRMSAR